MSITWNPWHGCHKISEGCANCYVYRTDAKHGRDSSLVEKNTAFGLPVARNRSRSYKVPPGEMVFTCFSSDFLVEDADPWRQEAWEMMRMRGDVTFLFLTKRIGRLAECLPKDWGEGYDNVQICCTAENQRRAQERLPILRKSPIAKKGIVCEPLLGRIDLSPYLGSWISQVVVGGESGRDARICDYAWVLDIREQCLQAGVPFHFKQTGARFLKDGKLYQIPRGLQHKQARKAAINHNGRKPVAGAGGPFEAGE